MIDLPRRSIREVRERLADVVDQAGHDRPTLITRRGRPVAALVSLEFFRHCLELEERDLNRIIDERESQRSGNAPGDLPRGTAPLEDVLRETLSRAE